MSTEQAADPQKAANAALGKFFELNKQGYSRCLHYNMDCKKDAIRAHSIQNNKVLDLLQRDNHVIVPKNKIIAGKATAEFGPLGRHQASTFTGLVQSTIRSFSSSRTPCRLIRETRSN